MDKFKILAILVSVLILAAGTGFVYSADEFQQAASEELEQSQGYEKFEGKLRELRDKYSSLLKKFEAIKEDRDNLIVQAKRLLQEKNRAKELESSLENYKTKEQLLKAEKEQLLNQNQKLEAEAEQLLDMQIQLEAERNRFREAYEKLKEGTTIRELEETVTSLQKKHKEKFSALQSKYNILNSSYRKAQREISRLKRGKDKAEKKIVELRENLDEFKKNYAVATRKNKALEKEIRNVPGRFSKLARQNKTLIKETSEMHYNLGVFYTKSKEYKRALAEFAKAVEINPDNTYAHFNLGYIYAEYLVERRKSVEHFRHFLRLSKSDDQDVDWVRKYLLTWETYEGKKTMR